MTEPKGDKVYVAGMWRRLLAAGLDTLVLAPIFLFVGWLAIQVTGMNLPTVVDLRPESLLEMLIEGGGILYGALAMGLFLLLLYGSLFMMTTGATPGLRLLRLKVINVYGGVPEWWRIVLRCCGFLVSCILLGLGFLWAGFDREKRGLPDWMAGTYVVSTKQPNRT